MDVQLTWTDCDEAGDYVVPDNMDKTVLHTLAFPTRSDTNWPAQLLKLVRLKSLEMLDIP